MIANITGRYPGVPFDLACVLEVGEHPDITKSSYVTYERCRTISQKNYDSWILGRLMTMTAPASPALIKRLCDGLLASEHVTPKLKRYFETHGR